MKKIEQASATLIEVADFFHALAHQKDLTIAEGMKVSELGRKAGIPAPQSLRGTVIQSTSTSLPKAREGQPLLTVDYGDPRPGGGTMEFKKCVTVGTSAGPASGSVKVCIDCSIIKMKCTITISGTITIG